MFMQAKRLVICVQTGKHSFCLNKQEHSEKWIVSYWGTLKPCFDSSRLGEDLISNGDEVHFFFNMENARIIGIRGDMNVKYAEVTYVDEGIEIMLQVSVGRFGKLECLMLIFKNLDRLYPVLNLPHNVPGICYCSPSKDWMEKRKFSMHQYAMW